MEHEAERLERLEPGQPVPYGGDRVARVTPELAAAFRPGDRLIVDHESGDLLHVPAVEQELVDEAVGRAVRAFHVLATVSDEQITDFFDRFARRLDDDEAFAPIAAANAADVDTARADGRSTSRLVLSPQMRSDMAQGLRAWRDANGGRDTTLERVEHDGWTVERRQAPLGVVGFVFEGRPNVFADATGVLRTGNTVVFRIGRDALGTAIAIAEHALTPSLEAAGLPAGAAQLLASSSRASGLALFADRRLGLAVARGSGPAVAQLGSVARQSGVPVSLHGTGGAWLVAGEAAAADRFAASVRHSLDRKVCNTLNVCCIVKDRCDDLAPRLLATLEEVGERHRAPVKLHVVAGSELAVPEAWFERTVGIVRPDGVSDEPQAALVSTDELGREWEWDGSPELTFAVVDSLDEAIELFNRLSPRLVASLISDDRGEQDRFWDRIDAPFVGDGFTRWVDGQFAFDRPELGLSSWQHGRLLGRGGVLAGDSIVTVRARATQLDPELHR